MVVHHPVTTEGSIDGSIAVLPSCHLVTHAKCFAGSIQVEVGVHVAEIVAQSTVSTRATDVVWVQACLVVRCGQPHVAVAVGIDTHVWVALAILDHRDTRGLMFLHAFVCLLTHALDVVGVIHGHVIVVLVLNGGVRQAVAHADASEVDVDAFLVLVSLENTVRYSRCEVTSIAFTEDVKLIALVLGVLLVEGLQEVVGILRHLLFVVQDIDLFFYP